MQLARFSQVFLELTLVGFAVTLCWGLITESINSRNLLYGSKRDATRYFSPERVLVLVGTVGVALQMVTQGAHDHWTTMPVPPPGALAALGVTHGIYLGGKSLTLLKLPKKTGDKNHEL